MLMRVYAHHFPDEVIGMVLVDSLHEDQSIRIPEIQEKTFQIQTKQFRMLGLLSSSGLTALAPQFIPNHGLPKAQFAQWQAILAKPMYYNTTLAELISRDESSAEVRALQLTSFGDLPLVVLSRGRWDPYAELTETENQQIKEGWQDLQSELAPLSTESRQVDAEQSGHHIQLDQPDLVIDAIREMVDALRK
jgi:pimeloyl-ACP methyl ester carboxylesterase